jgi:predicted  nucleic acid-binding Zn-ribbon protein
LNKHLAELIELSKLDKSIDDFTPLIETAQKKVARRTAKRDEVAEKIAGLSKEAENAKSKIASFEEQIKALNHQLTLGVAKEKEVKTDKEAKALQMEAELAKEKLTFANEEIARHNKILDAKVEELEKMNAELVTASEELEKVSNEIAEKLATIDDDKARLFASREEKTMAFDMKILSFYEKIRVWAKNTAVVPVKKQACYGCYMKLNDSAYSTVIKSDEIITCPHCGRILYLDPQTDTTTATAYNEV